MTARIVRAAETSTSLAPAFSFVPAAPPITRTFNYQTVDNGSTFLHSIAANGASVEMPVAHRRNHDPESLNSSVKAQQKFHNTGLLREVTTSGGTDTDPTAKDRARRSNTTRPTIRCSTAAQCRSAS